MPEARGPEAKKPKDENARSESARRQEARRARRPGGPESQEGQRARRAREPGKLALERQLFGEVSGSGTKPKSGATQIQNRRKNIEPVEKLEQRFVSQ